MKISHPSLRTILAGSLLVFPSATALVFAQGGCPPIIAALFPKDASNPSGQYFPGDRSTGKGSADVPFSFENPSCKRVEYTARITVEVTNYGGESAILIKSDESPFGPIDRDTLKARFMTDATSELTQTRMTPQRETLGIGEIVYVESKSECPPVGQATSAARIGPIVVPNVKLKGVAWAGNATVEVTLDGPISVERAKAAVAEVFANLQKADFSKAQ
jgi:hypothetical protein